MTRTFALSLEPSPKCPNRSRKLTVGASRRNGDRDTASGRCGRLPFFSPSGHYGVLLNSPWCLQREVVSPILSNPTEFTTDLRSTRRAPRPMKISRQTRKAQTPTELSSETSCSGLSISFRKLGFPQTSRVQAQDAVSLADLTPLGIVQGPSFKKGSLFEKKPPFAPGQKGEERLWLPKRPQRHRSAARYFADRNPREPPRRSTGVRGLRGTRVGQNAALQVRPGRDAERLKPTLCRPGFTVVSY